MHKIESEGAKRLGGRPQHLDLSLHAALGDVLRLRSGCHFVVHKPEMG